VFRASTSPARRSAHRVAVIGGGISGLASAVRLSRLGHPVTLYEGDAVLGGLGVTFPYRDGNLEKFYHCILPNDDALIDLIRQVGLEDDLLWRDTGMGFMHRGRVYPMNTALDLLRFTPLSLIDRLRLGLMAVRTRFDGTSPRLDGIPVDEWIRRMVGRRAFELMWKPLLEAKIGDGYESIPALWLSSRMSREKNTKKEVKGCLRGGYKSLVDAIERTLRAEGATIRMNTRVDAIERDGEAMVVRSGDQRDVFDTVVATSPLSQFQAMSAPLGLPSEIRDLRLDYQGVVSAVFTMRQPLSTFYWMPVVDSGATCQGIIEMSNLVPLARSDGRYVTYLVNYTHRESPLFARPEAELLAAYRADLERLFPEAADSIEDAFLFRAPFVEPIWPLGYSAMRPSPTVIPGRLYLASTAQVYPRVNSWNSCCEVVDELVDAFEVETAPLLTGESIAA
jgi:protoporphyrinogen oxidase